MVSSTTQVVGHNSTTPSLLLVMVAKMEKNTILLETPGVLLGVTKDTSRLLLKVLVLVSVVSNRYLSTQQSLEKLKNLSDKNKKLELIFFFNLFIFL